MEKEKLLTVVFMTILSLVCAYFGDMIFDFFTAADIGAAMGFSGMAVISMKNLTLRKQNCWT